jgi:hypothetical protein
LHEPLLLWQQAPTVLLQLLLTEQSTYYVSVVPAWCRVVQQQLLLAPQAA